MEPKILEVTAASIAKAAEVIKKGGLLIFPTDTVYGLGGNALNPQVTSRISILKRRAADKPLPVLIGEISQLNFLVEAVPPSAEMLIKRYWPGALTLVFPKKHGGKIGIRWPNSEVVWEIIKQAGTPLIGTSANLSGEENVISVKNLPRELIDGVDLVLDGGELTSKASSTVVDVTVNPPQVLREGAINIYAL